MMRGADRLRLTVSLAGAMRRAAEELMAER